MKKLIYLFAIIAVCLSAKQTKAQTNDGYVNFYYSMGLGTGDMGDFISKYSWRGVGLEFKSELSDNIMVGLGCDWNVFYENMDYGTYTKDNLALSGTQFRYTNFFPMTGKINYFKDLESGLRIFGGTGIGTTYLIRDVDMGSYRLQTNTWQFLLVPELGVTYDLDAAHSLLLSVKYNANFKSKELPGQSYVSFNIGFAFNQ